MPLSLEEIEDSLTSLAADLASLGRKVKRGIGDWRVPQIATTYDIEDAIFPPKVRVFNSANISTDTGVAKILTFDSERWDTHSMHSTTTNTSRLTCTVAGNYLIIAHVWWAEDSRGWRSTRIKLNGTTYIANAGGSTPDTVGKVENNVQIATTLYDLVVGDYIEVEVFQNSSATVNVNFSANFSPEFMAVRVSP